MGTTAELRATGLVRLLDIVDVIARHLAREEPELVDGDARAASAAIAAAVMAGAAGWIEAGTSRGPLSGYVHHAVQPVITGWRARIGAVD